MTYLSEIHLNPLRTYTQRLVGSPQRLHAAVMGAFPRQPETGRLLWRLEQRDHRYDLLVLSPECPSWAHLIEDAGWPGADGGDARVADYTPVLAYLMAGRRFAFRLTANPVENQPMPLHPTTNQAERAGDPDRKRSPRLGQRTADYQMHWFLKRCADGAGQWGFTVGSSADPSVSLVGRQMLQFSRQRGEPPVTLNTATFQGHLTVTDAGLMRRSLLSGVGSGKAYGCGLLTLARA